MLQRHPFSPTRGSAIPALVLVAGFISAGAALANPRATVMRVEAESLAGEGNCEQAVEVLERAREETPRDAYLAHLQGQCEIHLRRYGAAVRSLRAARRNRTDLPDLHLHLGMALFHTGDFQGAADAFHQAEDSGSVSPQLDLYRGLLLLSQHQTLEASRVLERARTADPEAVEPAASYYSGMAYSIVDDRESAVRALQRVVEEDPDGDWGRAAQAALDKALKSIPYWVNARLGFEYDNNVTMLGIHGGSPQHPPGGSDIRGVWHIDGGAQLLNTRNVTGGLLVSYSGSKHNEQTDFDVDYPSLSAWVDWQIDDKLLLRSRYDFGYSWTGGELPFLIENDLSASLFRDWGFWGTTELASRVFLSNFLYQRGDQPDANPDNSCDFNHFAACGPHGLNEADYRNPDGVGVILGLNHSYNFDFWNSVVWGGYFWELYEAHGKEHDRMGHHLRVGLETTLPFHEVFSRMGWGETIKYPVRFRGNFRWSTRNYDHVSSYPDPQWLWGDSQDVGYFLGTRLRQDVILQTDLELRYQIFSQLVAAFRFSDTHHFSTTRLFDYRRRVMGLHLTGSFP